jgi:hypothetical protein
VLTREELGGLNTTPGEKTFCGPTGTYCVVGNVLA